MNLGLSMIWFWAAYVLVSIIGVMHTVFNWKVLKMEIPKDVEVKPSQVPAYIKTKPFHVLYNILIFPVFAYVYLKQIDPGNLWEEVLAISISWTVITIVIDLIGWVLIKHPWHMTFKEMYIDYQPWISLIYVTIFVSPFIAAGIVGF